MSCSTVLPPSLTSLAEEFLSRTIRSLPGNCITATDVVVVTRSPLTNCEGALPEKLIRAPLSAIGSVLEIVPRTDAAARAVEARTGIIRIGENHFFEYIVLPPIVGKGCLKY